MLLFPLSSDIWTTNIPILLLNSTFNAIGYQGFSFQIYLFFCITNETQFFSHCIYVRNAAALICAQSPSFSWCHAAITVHLKHFHHLHHLKQFKTFFWLITDFFKTLFVSTVTYEKWCVIAWFGRMWNCSQAFESFILASWYRQNIGFISSLLLLPSKNYVIQC